MYILLSGVDTTLPDLPPLRRHVPFSVFYRSVKALISVSLTQSALKKCDHFHLNGSKKRSILTRFITASGWLTGKERYFFVFPSRDILRFGDVRSYNRNTACFKHVVLQGPWQRCLRAVEHVIQAILHTGRGGTCGDVLPPIRGSPCGEYV